MNARTADKLATGMFWAGALTVIALLLFLIGYILYHGAKVIDWHFLTSPPTNIAAGGGIGPQIFNSFYLLVLSMLITVPIGLLAGVYMAEYAKNGPLVKIIRTCIETLASLPSIVVGLFGLIIFVNMTGWGYSILAGAFALSVINLPFIVRVTEESITGVQKEYKEGSLALGATKWQTIVKVLLPTAFPGLITGFVISAGRIFGEAAALLYTAGMSSPNLNFSRWLPTYPTSPFNPFRPGETLAVHIWKVNSESLIPDVRAVADGSAAVLIIVVLLFNILARWIGRRMQKRMG
ncbi:phosphate ABC transporter permease [Thermincola ferriacetica]|uniref:Phosphate transport system permease protein PstA n=1 Tax=Thermincola ferriacetica TaxID=281456 RepID=A0A0L6W532_9FIRM|nr:phosphate ABC transporter permease PstA [Thermincola ferriacetica]KNZ70640.1 phosphate ABC transporter permease [Thermincola ferriacetica]